VIPEPGVDDPSGGKDGCGCGRASAGSDTPLRLLHITAPGHSGGLESVVQGLAIGHHRRGHEVHVLAVVGQGEGEHPFLRPLQEAGVAVHVLPLPTRAYVRERREVAALLRRLQPYVVHTHGTRPDVLDAGPARRLGIPTATTLHGYSRMGGKARAYEWIHTRALRRFDAVIAVSGPLVGDLRRWGVPDRRVHLVPNAWPGRNMLLPRGEARARLGIQSDSFCIGWVGRLIPIKGADVFLQAIASIPELPASFVIVGDGPERQPLGSLARKLRVDARVTFVGGCPEAAMLFSAFDIFVLSSRSEGTPMVLFEAMAAGVPVVAAGVGGVPDVIGSGAGWIVPPEDPEALGWAIVTAASDRTAANARAEVARMRLEREFGPEMWLDRHEALYWALHREKRATRRFLEVTR
jgi:glycosyltransferase involved in cell wall biosynthesis